MKIEKDAANQQMLFCYARAVYVYQSVEEVARQSGKPRLAENFAFLSRVAARSGSFLFDFLGNRGTLLLVTREMRDYMSCEGHADEGLTFGDYCGLVGLVTDMPFLNNAPYVNINEMFAFVQETAHRLTQLTLRALQGSIKERDNTEVSVLKTSSGPIESAIYSELFLQGVTFSILQPKTMLLVPYEIAFPPTTPIVEVDFDGIDSSYTTYETHIVAFPNEDGALSRGDEVSIPLMGEGRMYPICSEEVSDFYHRLARECCEHIC